MKIVIAPNALKGSVTSYEAAKAIEMGVLKVIPEAETVCVPVADGGDGLVEVVQDALLGKKYSVSVRDPLNSEITADYCYVGERRIGAVEMALASGLALLSDEQRDPTVTTTYGTGELINAVIERGAEHVYVGIGGSATTDGGVGMAAALGGRFLDVNGSEVNPIGGELINIAHIDIAPLVKKIGDVSFDAVCDVDNPLLGEHGAAHVYGPQKGATPDQVKELEAGLANLADIIESDLGVDVRHLAGAGAAGGLGAGLYAFLGAKLRPGIEVVFDMVELDKHLDGADLVLTAEGQIDFQTKFGKAPGGVAECAKKHNIPCLAIAGSIGERIDELHEIGMQAVFSLCPGPVSLETAMANGADYLTRAAEQIIRAFLAGSKC
jgi:glycerate kinase